VAGRLWQVDGADLLAAAYAFHAGLPRQAATAAHVQAMQQPGLGPAGAQPQPSVSPGRPGTGDPDDWTARPGSPARSVAPPLDPHRLPGPRLGELDPADAAKLWALVSELPGSQFIPRSQLIRLTGVLPADLAARLLRLLDGGPELVGAQAARIGTAIDPNDPATPALAVIVLGWLEAAQQVLAAREQLSGAAGAVERGRPPRPGTLARQQRLGGGRPREARQPRLCIPRERPDHRFGRESVLGLPGGVRLGSASSWTLARGGGCPGCRPSMLWPRSAPGANTRHERLITYAPAWRQPQGRRSSRGDPWETPPSIATLAGRPSLQPPDPGAPGQTPGGGLLLHKSAQRHRNEASGAGHEPPNLSSHIGLSRPVQATHRVRAVVVGLPAWVVPGGSAA
jgi:hypothetical protein